MIQNYRSIGELLIAQKGIEDKNSHEYKTYILSSFCSNLKSYTKVDESGVTHIGRMLCLNLSTTHKTAEFLLADELTAVNASKLMLFQKHAPKDPNIFGTTNAFSSIATFDLWNSLNSDTLKEVKWSRPTKAVEFHDAVLKLKDTFFVETKLKTNSQKKVGYLLNLKLLKTEQQALFPDSTNDPAYKDFIKVKDYSGLLKKQLDKYLKKTLSDIYDDSQGYALMVDGKYLHDWIYSVEYIDFLYYKLIENNYSKSIDWSCHLCSVKGKIGKDVSLIQKFYGTTNPLFFDGVNKTKTYTSFGICTTCDHNLLVGMRYAWQRLHYYLLDLNCIVIPDTRKETGLIDPDDLKSVVSVLNYRKGRRNYLQTDIETLIKLSKRSTGFNLLFYDKDPKKQEFKIVEYIRGLNYSQLALKAQDLDEIFEQTKLYTIGEYYDLNLKGLRMMIIPSSQSHKLKTDGDYASVSRKIAKLVNDYLSDIPLQYWELIRDFIKVWSHVQYNNKDTYLDHELAPYMFGLYLKHLHNYNLIKGVKPMEQCHKTTTSLDPVDHTQYIEYFDNNGYLFWESQNSKYYQGLFLMGVLIARIENEEYKKTKKKTFSNRLNYTGIQPRQVKALSGIVEGYLDIRKVWRDEQMTAYWTECLLEIENSSVSPNEIVYYILAGKAYENYLGIMYNKTKAKNTQSEEDKND